MKNFINEHIDLVTLVGLFLLATSLVTALYLGVEKQHDYLIMDCVEFENKTKELCEYEINRDRMVGY